MKKTMRLVVVSGLSNAKLYSKLAPLLALESVEEIALVRRQPLDEPGIRNYCPPPWLRHILPLAELYRFFTVLWLCLRSPRPDRLIGIYLIPHGLYVGLIGWLLRIKTIQIFPGSDLPLVLRNRLLLNIVRKAHKVGVRGENSLGQLAAKNIPPERIFIPPNIFDVESNAPDPDALIESTYDLIFVGSLVGVKQLDLLLHAIVILYQCHPQVKLVLVGNGVLRDELEVLAAKLNIESNVIFLGAMPPEEIRQCLSKARLFVMTSKVEGLPMAMIEALSCGLPVIMPDVGDVTTVAHHGENAWIVSPPTADNFAKAISTLLEDNGLYLRLREGALRSRKRFRSEYSLAAATEIWARALEIRNGR